MPHVSAVLTLFISVRILDLEAKTTDFQLGE